MRKSLSINTFNLNHDFWALLKIIKGNQINWWRSPRPKIWWIICETKTHFFLPQSNLKNAAWGARDCAGAFECCFTVRGAMIRSAFIVASSVTSIVFIRIKASKITTLKHHRNAELKQYALLRENRIWRYPVCVCLYLCVGTEGLLSWIWFTIAVCCLLIWYQDSINVKIIHSSVIQGLSHIYVLVWSSSSPHNFLMFSLKDPLRCERWVIAWDVLGSTVCPMKLAIDRPCKYYVSLSFPGQDVNIILNL